MQNQSRRFDVACPQHDTDARAMRESDDRVSESAEAIVGGVADIASTKRVDRVGGIIHLDTGEVPSSHQIDPDHKSGATKTEAPVDGQSFPERRQ